MSMASPSEVLSFWFEEIESKRWFIKSLEFDELVRGRFGSVYEDAKKGALESWAETPEGCAALIIVLDQFSRNLFRDDARSFESDKNSLALAHHAIEKKWLDLLPPLHTRFVIMPLMHSEELADQEASIPLFEKYANESTVEYAHAHRDVIARFGRFPHRNKILGRQNTPEEEEFLSQPGSSF